MQLKPVSAEIATKGGTWVMIHVEVFWVASPRNFVVGYHRFRGPCCLHHQVDVISLHGVTTQKTSI